MASADYFKTIEKAAFAEFKDRGSRFLAYAFPLGGAGDFKARLQELKKEHPKAVHHCFAYRKGLDGLDYRSSDDGEPSGTAGKPILGQIDSKELTDVCIIVVRYFGGTLLGVPGLIHAYKSAASQVLQVVPIIQKEVTAILTLYFDYTRINEVMRIVKMKNCEVTGRDLQLFCTMTLAVPIRNLQALQAELSEIPGISFQFR